MDTLSNEDKASNAEQALLAHLTAKGDPDDPAERQTDIQDLISDLLHLAQQEGVEDVSHMLGVAQRNYEAECEFVEEESKSYGPTPR